jgi:RimJ/RimL family protein N-acetyltransferase
MRAEVHIERWSAADHDLLTALNGDPAMMAHLGGPETPGKIAERQARYEAASDAYRIVDAVTGAGAGWVGFWGSEGLDGAAITEIGWSVAPAFQGRGFASTATALALDLARAGDGPRAVHAYPGVDNAASNAVCRSVGFTLVAAGAEAEYPPGRRIVVNDWRYDL